MEKIKIEVFGNIARVTERPRKITSGTVGLPVEFVFDNAWDGLKKTAVFRVCNVSKKVDEVNASTIVPWEVLVKPGDWLTIGVFGTNEDGSLTISAAETRVSQVYPGTSPECQCGADPKFPDWTRMLIGQSAYELAVETGFKGTEEEWLKSLKGEQGDITSELEALREAVANDLSRAELASEAAEDAQTRAEMAAEEVAEKAVGYIVASGKDITIENAPESVLRGLKLYGWSQQNDTWVLDCDLSYTGTNPNHFSFRINSTTKGTFTLFASRWEGSGTKLYTGMKLNATPTHVHMEVDLATGAYQLEVGGTSVASGTNMDLVTALTETTGLVTVEAISGTVLGSEADDSYRMDDLIIYTRELQPELGPDTEPEQKYVHFEAPGQSYLNGAQGHTFTNPVEPGEIVSAGADGDIVVTIDGETPQNITAQTPNGLPGIKVSSNGNYTDSTGRQWLCNIKDFAQGVNEEWLWKYSPNVEAGSLSRQTNYDGNGWFGWCVSDERFMACGNGWNDNPGYSTRFDVANNCVPTGVNQFRLWGERGFLYFTIDTDDKETAMQIINSTVFYLPLAEPIITPLTKEEMAQFAALHTNYPTTTILNDEGVGMEVSYYLPQAALPVSGGTMGGNINMGNNRIVGLSEPLGDTDAVRKKYVHANFAPAGYGLGTTAKNCEDCNTSLDTGWYQLSNSTLHKPSGTAFTYAVMQVIRRKDYQTVQIVYAIGNTNAMAFRQKYGWDSTATWGEWEYINPPMNTGVEYRTTERWNGQPVYVKVVSFGVLPNNGQLSVEHGISNFHKVLRCQMLGRYTSMLITNWNIVTDIGVDVTNIHISTNENANGVIVDVGIWYVKN